MTRDTRGRLTVDGAQIIGAYGAGMISTLWYPARYNPASKGLETGSLNLAIVAGVHVVRQFSPELKHLLGFKR